MIASNEKTSQRYNLHTHFSPANFVRHLLPFLFAIAALAVCQLHAERAYDPPPEELKTDGSLPFKGELDEVLKTGTPREQYAAARKAWKEHPRLNAAMFSSI